MNEPLFVVLITIVAFTHALVGHGGASGYLALMGMAHVAPETMKPAALVMNLCVSLTGFVNYRRANYFRWELFWPFALLSIPFAFVGAGIPLERDLHLLLLGLCVMVAALRMLGGINTPDRPLGRVPPAAALLFGGRIGLLVGMLGIGGGILLGPVLLLCGWADAKVMAATSVLFIFVNSASGLARVQGLGHAITNEVLLWTVVAIVGGVLSSWLGARRAPEPRSKQALGLVLLLASIKLIWP
jgi:hypothetical protein